MKNILGLSTGVFNGTVHSLLERVKLINQLNVKGIEICLGQEYYFHKPWIEELDKNFFKLLENFTFVSIHSPTDIIIPSKNSQYIIDILNNLIKNINPKLIVFHPDKIADYQYVENNFSKLLAYENMDPNKTTGQTIDDMTTVFMKSPKAGFVFDINHAYSCGYRTDQINEFINIFQNKLKESHISSVNKENFHTFYIYEQNQAKYLNLLRNKGICLMHEGVIDTKLSINEGLKVIKKEINFLEKYI